MQFGDNGAQKSGIVNLNRAGDFRDKLMTNPAILIAHRMTVEQVSPRRTPRIGFRSRR